MMDNQNNYQMDFEEKKAVKLFIWLFYIIFFGFELIWNIIVPKFLHKNMIPFGSDGIGYWYYILIVILLPISIFLLKNRNPYNVKYFILIGYLLIDFIDNFFRYYGSSDSFANGGAAEVLVIFYAPIFINKKFFWIVVFSVICKYALLGLVLLDPNVIFPIVFYFILSGCAYILVNRLFSYIHSLTAVQNELHQKEKLVAIGQMATAISHEIRNPLATLKGFTQLQKESYPNTNDYYSIMIQEIDRINTIVNDLLYLGKPKSIHFQKAKIEDIISYIISLMQNMAIQKEVSIESNIEPSLPELECDENQIKQVLLNLIKNAIEAMNSGKIDIQAKKQGKNQLFVSIQDEGSGISDLDIHKLGKAFYTTKSDGTGLGLLITNQIIQDHNGHMNIRSNLGKGTIVEITLPFSQS